MSSKRKIRLYHRLDIRLTVWYTLTFLTTTILIFGFLDYRLRHNLLKEIDRMLVDDAHEIINEVLEDPANLILRLEELKKTISRRKFYRIAFRILDSQGNLIYSSSQLRGIHLPFPKLPLNLSPHKMFICKNLEIPPKSSPFRLCTYFYEENNKLKYIVQVATYLRPLKKTVINFRRNLGIAFFLAILFGSLGGWLLSRRSLRPIDKITATTEKITATNLSQRLPLQGTNDELDRLAITINKMIERLEKSFQKLTQFTADAAHELRTPIAALKGETEVLLSRKRSSEEYRDALVNNLERLDFLTRLINDLLILSQADEGKQSLQVEKL
jgi:HAMP domain-containing protein